MLVPMPSTKSIVIAASQTRTMAVIVDLTTPAQLSSSVIAPSEGRNEAECS
jgi:hypothetical protein